MGQCKCSQQFSNSLSLCFVFTVNNTLPEAEHDRGKAKELDIDTYSHKEISKTKEKENTAVEKESVGEKGVDSGHENTTAVSTEDKYSGIIPEKIASEGRNEGEPQESNNGSDKATGDSEDKVGITGHDNNLNTVANKEPEAGKSPENKEDTNFDLGKTDITEILVRKDKGQEEKERKEEQVNGKRDPDKVSPNDTKLRTVTGEGENALEPFEVLTTKNNSKADNNSVGSPDSNKTVPTRVNITQHTAQCTANCTQYQAGSEKIRDAQEKPIIKEDIPEGDSTEKTKEDLEKEREDKEKEKEKEANLSFVGKGLRNKRNEYELLHVSLHWLSVPHMQTEAAHLSLASTTATTRRCQGWSPTQWSFSATIPTLSAVTLGVPASQTAPGVANNLSASEVQQRYLNAEDVLIMCADHSI